MKNKRPHFTTINYCENKIDEQNYVDVVQKIRNAISQIEVERERVEIITKYGYDITISGLYAEDVKKAAGMIFNELGIPEDTKLGLPGIFYRRRSSVKAYIKTRRLLKERGYKLKLFPLCEGTLIGYRWIMPKRAKNK